VTNAEKRRGIAIKRAAKPSDRYAGFLIHCEGKKEIIVRDDQPIGIKKVAIQQRSTQGGNTSG